MPARSVAAAHTKFENYDRPSETEIALLLRASQKRKQHSLLGGRAGDTAAPPGASPPVSSRWRSPTSSPDCFGRPPHLTEPPIPSGTSTSTQKGPRPSLRARDATPGNRPRPAAALLDSEPRRIPGLEVAQPSEYQSDLAPDQTGPSARAVPPEIGRASCRER